MSGSAAVNGPGEARIEAACVPRGAPLFARNMGLRSARGEQLLFLLMQVVGWV